MKPIEHTIHKTVPRKCGGYNLHLGGRVSEVEALKVPDYNLRAGIVMEVLAFDFSLDNNIPLTN